MSVPLTAILLVGSFVGNRKLGSLREVLVARGEAERPWWSASTLVAQCSDPSLDVASSAELITVIINELPLLCLRDRFRD